MYCKISKSRSHYYRLMLYNVIYPVVAGGGKKEEPKRGCLYYELGASGLPGA